jgi:2-methylcitrate dehydratase PrpD
MSYDEKPSRVADGLADWGASLNWGDLPDRIRHDARVVWLDTVGSLYLGRDHPEVTAVGRALLDSDGEGAFDTIAGLRLSSRNACLVNGLAIGIDLFDGGNAASGGHVAGYIMPAVLAEAQRQNATLEQALVGFVVGYEVACRIGSSQRLRPELHPSGTWNVIGAAVAVARLRDASAALLARTIELAANLTLTTSWDATIHGATVRDVYHGMPSYLGSLAADLARAGIDGGPRSVEVTFGMLCSTQPFDTASATADLGTRWLLDQTYTKVHPTCRSFHAALDAALQVTELIPRDADLEALDVTVGTEPFAFQQNAKVHFESPLAARESLPVSAALALATGRLTPHQFRAEAYTAPQILSLAQRIGIVCEPRATAVSRPGWVHVRGDGIDVRRDVDIPAGNPGNLLTEEVVIDKFHANASAMPNLNCDVANDVLTGPLDRPCMDVLRSDLWSQ